MKKSVHHIIVNRLCQGCGACFYICSFKAIKLQDFPHIGIRPIVDLNTCTNCGDCLNICSGYNLAHDRKSWPQHFIKELSTGWGPVLEIWEGHALDETIRIRGGSGGVVTALSLFCIEQEDMHGVLHVLPSKEHPIENNVTLSTNRASVIEGAASRYSPAAVCGQLDLVEKAPKPCVIVGKPCDIAGAQNIGNVQPKFKGKMGLTLSIFCGGTPSSMGTHEILNKLNINNNDVENFRYRGFGWPGMTGAKVKQHDVRIEMTYQQAWDTILTKHKPFRCHICPDGTGEFADISCGDPWYRKREDNDPGTTLIIVRTLKGKAVLRKAMAAGYIHAVLKPYDVLPQSQAGLLLRREHVLNKIFWLKVFRLPSPTFLGFSLLRSWFNLPHKRKFESFWKTGKWILSIKRQGPLHL